MVAGDKEKQLRKIPELECDVVMINLEDGVSDKKAALKLIIALYKELKLNKYKKIVIRVNGVEEGGLDEIKALNSLKPYAIRVAKIESFEHIQKALDVLDDDIDLHLSIETKAIFDTLSQIKIDSRITTVYLGILDLLESLSLPQSLIHLDNPMIDYLLSRFLIDSKIAGVHSVGFMFQDYHNTQAFEKWCKKLKTIGFQSASCLGPKQVTIANKIFSIDKDAIQKAQLIKKLFEEKKVQGITGFDTKEFGFVDEPIYKNALLVLNSANIK